MGCTNLLPKQRYGITKILYATTLWCCFIYRFRHLRTVALRKRRICYICELNNVREITQVAAVGTEAIEPGNVLVTSPRPPKLECCRCPPPSPLTIRTRPLNRSDVFVKLFAHFFLHSPLL